MALASGSNGTVNRLKAKEAVWKYVRFLEPSIWQRQRPNKAADSCTNNWFVESKFGFLPDWRVTLSPTLSQSDNVQLAVNREQHADKLAHGPTPEHSDCPASLQLI